MKQEVAIAGVGATPYYFRGESAPQLIARSSSGSDRYSLRSLSAP